MPAPDPRSGVLGHNKNKSTPGYTIVTPLCFENMFLIHMNGHVVHQWDLPATVGNYACRVVLELVHQRMPAAVQWQYTHLRGHLGAVV